jgi:ubiquinol-cytochrome c reductase cytochrome b subunit
MRRVGLHAAVAAALVLACSHEPKTLEQKGAGVFLRACSGCHGPSGKGAARPGFTVPPRDLTTSEAGALTDEHIVGVIRNGKGQMPPFGRMLPEDDVTAVLAFVRTLHAPARAAKSPGQSASATRAP